MKRAIGRRGPIAFPSLEARGFELGNALSALLRYCRERGINTGTKSGWARAAAYVSRYLDDDDMDTVTVVQRAEEIGLDVAGTDMRSLLFAATLEVGAAARENWITGSARQIAHDVGLTAALREEIGARRMRTIGAIDETAEQRKKRKARERAAKARAARPDHKPRKAAAEATKPWEAMGISRRSYYRHVALKRHAFNLSKKNRRANETVPTAPGERDEIVPTPTAQKRAAS